MEAWINWINENPILFLVIVAWILFWKGKALWKAAQLNQKYWFVALLIINTLGLLELYYIYFVTRKYKVEVIEKEN